jgi:tetratricopeptide (TPR) repeat protein
MNCPRCGRENREGRKFCAECAAPLSLLCPHCQAPNEPGEKFCGECGKSLTAESPPTPTPTPAPSKSATPPPSAAAPSAFVGERYQAIKFLGEGGKKKVFLAKDTLLDREVAFALIKHEGLDDTARLRIRREAQAMGRLGSHPHIVTVFDLGEENGQPYMVTEFMRGGDVEHLIDKAPNHRVPMERVLQLGNQVAEGLKYAHERGIVHRDLKPGNVWLTQEGAAKIGDFGLALPLNRSRLTREGMMVGTVAYMPPEQAMGGEVTPKADLYSLGCMLYECIAGRPPFLGDDAVAVIGQHLHTPPVAPSWHNAKCPRDLEALVLRLLAKDPEQRPASAAEVLTALEGVDLSAVTERAEEESRSLDSLAGGVFVGRQREMGELKASLEDALAGRGRLAMLVGEPGIGKTRTALELATYAGLRQAQVLWGRCYESQGMPAYWPWVQAIRSYVREREPSRLKAEMGSGAADIAEIVSDVRERLPDLKAPPPLEDPEAARFRLFDSIASFFKSAAKAQPLVLILDDLHWADKSTLLLLQFVAGELAQARILIIGTYRDVELSRKHPLAQALGELTRERAFQRVLLRGLSQEDVERFIELTSGIKPPEGLVKAVYTQTEGNPMFVNEVVRLLVQEGELKPERIKGRKSWSLRIPEGVREVIGRRLTRLSERCNQVLTVAAVLGREFSLAQLVKMLPDLTEARLLDILEEALAARVVEELPKTLGAFQFTHALIQETLLQELSLTRRVRLHADIAEALEALYGKDAPAHAAELAHHYAEAEMALGTDKLVKYSLLAGEKALADRAHEEALAHFQRALEAKKDQPMDADLAAIYHGLGRAENALLMNQPMAQHLTAAFDYYLNVGDVPHAIAVAATTFTDNPGLALMMPVVERALAAVPEGSIQAGRLLCLQAAHLLQNCGDAEGSVRVSARALAIARQQGDQQLELRALTTGAVVMGGAQNGEEWLRRGFELLRTVDSPREESGLHFIATTLYQQRGDVNEALAHGKAMLQAAERLHERARLRTALTRLALLAMDLGDWATARDYVERAQATAGDMLGLQTRMRLESELGNIERADLCLQQVQELEMSVNAATAAALWIVLCARRTGNARWLHAAMDTAKRALSALSPTSMYALLAEVILALAAAEEHDAAGAREHLDASEKAQVLLGFYALSGALGIIAHAAGELEKGASYFEEEIARCRKGGYRPPLAWACCDYADLLLDRKAPGDEERAMALLDESLEISRDLGMVPLMERVLGRRKILKA